MLGTETDHIFRAFFLREGPSAGRVSVGRNAVTRTQVRECLSLCSGVNCRAGFG